MILCESCLMSNKASPGNRIIKVSLAMWTHPIEHVYCCEQGSIPKRSHSHRSVSFHNSTFIRGVLPSKPIKSHTGYTQRGRAYAIEASRASIRHKVPFTSGVHRGRGGWWSKVRPPQWQHGSAGVEVQQGSGHDPWCSQAQVWVWELWVLTAHQGQRSPLYWSPDGVFIHVSGLVVLSFPGPC